MAQKIEIMRQMVADLLALNVKFHNLHWNVKGHSFVPLHMALEEMYDLFFEQYDEVAERMRMLGEYAPASLKEVVALTKVEDLPNQDYTQKDVLDVVKASFEHLKALVRALRASCGDDDFVTASMCDDLEGAYDKQLWFTHQQMK
jgi:starvation-inducible DNA-binding protein